MRVLAAMSGGVDSAVVAGLLAEAGHQVIGATLQLYDARRTASRGTCCAGRDIHDARRIADHIGIPHYLIDAEHRFRDTVIAPFADSYASGETPVPCVRCNQGVKFTDLLGLARELGCDAMATGHYVRRVETGRGPELHRPLSPDRDQSWFLFATTREQLAFLRFPLGAMPDKSAVRDEARRLGIRIADKPDSQDICFVPDGAYDAVVAKVRPDALAPGDIVDEQGALLGRHEGIALFTVGQSKRLGPAAQRRGIRQSVRRVDPATNRVVVGPKEGLREGGTTTVRLSETNWLIDRPHRPIRCAVQTRAREAPRPAILQADGQTVTLDDPALVAPGQACVAYDGTRILGGGFIRREDPP